MFDYDTLKRGIDFLGAGCGLIALAPVMGATALAVAVSLGRPVFFTQVRPGLHGKPFRLVKFRTMRPPVPGSDGIGDDEARITRVGQILRSTSLDELPTLFNVLRGDMSLVGPRPLLMRYLDRYTPEQARRHEVRPGVTGKAQVSGRNALTWDEKFALDVWYVDHCSLAVDLSILAATVGKVLKRDGISQQGHVTMPEFTGTEADLR
jgi:sugar transferase EpsL